MDDAKEFGQVAILIPLREVPGSAVSNPKYCNLTRAADAQET